MPSIGESSLSSLVFIQHPNIVFPSIAFVFGLSLTATPALVPVTLLISVLHIYSRIIVRRPHTILRCLTLLVILSVSTSLAIIAPSLGALSSPTSSVFGAYLLSLLRNFVALVIVHVDTIVQSRLPARAPFARILLFPTLWATVWAGVAHISPVGRLLTWAPVEGLGGYEWLIPYLGTSTRDFIAASWAVVVSQEVGVWFMGSPPEDDQLLIVGDDGHLVDVEHTSDLQPATVNGHHPHAKLIQQKRPLSYAAFLFVLLIPSLTRSTLPLPPYSPNTTPFTVGCVLPASIKSKNIHFTLDDYIRETKELSNRADLLLWPESAVRFENPGDRDTAFDRIRTEVKGPWVAVSFEETVHDPADSTHRTALRRNGVALVHFKHPDLHFEYFKQHLVPVSESFSLTHSADPPKILEIPLGPPRGITKPEWAPGPGYTRSIPISASICLDFAFSDAFYALPSKPAVILAPGKTWHQSVGKSMFEQVRSRALELDSNILWCDGGEDAASNRALSGIVGPGLNEPFQSGRGSWVKTIGVPYPFDQEHKTPYARMGDLASLSWIWAVIIVGYGGGGIIERLRVGETASRLRGRGTSVVEWVRRHIPGRRDVHVEERNLLD